METLPTVLCPLLFFLAGGLSLPALWKLLAGRRAAANASGWESKLQATEQQLANAQSAAESHQSELATLQAELGATSSELKAQRNALTELTMRAQAAAQLEAVSQAKDAEIAALQAELAAWPSKLVALEAKAAVVPTLPAPELVDELASVKATLASKEEEIGRLLGRIAELAPLVLQLKERDLNLKKLEADKRTAVQEKDAALAHVKAELTAAVQVHASETAELHARLNNLESTTAELDQLRGELAVRDARLRDADTQLLELENRLKTAEQERLQAIAQRANESQLRVVTAAHALMLGDKNAEVARLRARIAELERAQATAQHQQRENAVHQATAFKNKDAAIALLQLRVKEVEPLNAQLAEREQKLKVLAAELAEAQATLTAQLAAAQSAKVFELNELQARWQNRFSDLQYQRSLADEHDTLSQPSWQLGELGANGGQFDVQLSSHTAQFNSLLEAKERELAAQLTDLAQANARGTAREAEVQRLRARIQELENTPRTPSPSSPQLEIVREVLAGDTLAKEQMASYQSAPPESGAYDDLKLIHGVGPVLEKLLHKLGIYYFRQVAGWNDADIAYVDAQLAKFKGRIRRENWVASAKAEHFKKYNEAL